MCDVSHDHVATHMLAKQVTSFIHRFRVALRAHADGPTLASGIATIMASSASNTALLALNQSHVTLSGLSKVLKSIREHGVPEVSSRTSIKRRRDLELPDVWTSIELVCNDKSTFETPIIHPGKYLEHLMTIEPFAAFVEKRLAEQPCPVDAPWNICLYADEVVPGNVLKAQGNQRKVVAWYWSFAEFGDALGDELMWFYLGCIRSSKLKDQRPKRTEKDVQGGWGQYFRKAAMLFFQRPRSMADGLLLRLPSGKLQMLVSKIGTVIADEAALKALWGVKGASGGMCCFLCRNCVLHSLDLHTSDTTGFLCSHAEAKFERFVPQTDATLLEAAQLLRNNYGVISKAAFSRKEFALGLNYSPEGPLWCDEFLKQTRGAVRSTQFDWMHVYLVNGVFHSELTLLMDELKSLLPLNQAHDRLQAFTFPKELQSRGVTGKGIFRKVDDVIKSSASEALSIYPVIRFVIMEVTAGGQSPAVARAVRSFFALCQVLDQLKLCFGRKQASFKELRAAVQLHTQCPVDAYGAQNMQPKTHYAGHLASFLERGDRLLSCFVHERKHKEVKKFAADIHNAREKSVAFEKSTMNNALLAQSQALASFERPDDLSLEKTRPAPAAFQGFLQSSLQCLQLVETSRELRGPGVRIFAHDLVLVTLATGERIGEIWFFAAQGRRILACWCAWERKGPNHYVPGHDPTFIRACDISRTLIYRQDADGTAHVVP